MHWRQFGGVWPSSSVIELWWWIIIEGETAKRQLERTDSYSFTQIKGVKGWKMKDSTSYQIIPLRLAGRNQSSDRMDFIPMGNDTPMTCFQLRSPSTVSVEFSCSVKLVRSILLRRTEQGELLEVGSWLFHIFRGVELTDWISPTLKFIESTFASQTVSIWTGIGFSFFLQKSKRGKSDALLLMKTMQRISLMPNINNSSRLLANGGPSFGESNRPELPFMELRTLYGSRYWFFWVPALPLLWLRPS